MRLLNSMLNLMLVFNLKLETFRFEEENDYEYDILLEVSSRLLKIQTSQKASFYYFSLHKLALLSLVKEVTRSPNRKMIRLLTFAERSNMGKKMK